MTAQIGDVYRYKGVEYDCLKLSDGRLFYAKEHGFHPSAVDTNCWDGYWCEFEITNVVKLQTLSIHDKDCRYPPLNGVSITPHSGTLAFVNPEMIHEKYENLDMPLDYTGRILLADGFIWQYRINIGLQRPFAYQTLLSVSFEKGVLKEVLDQSWIAEKLRSIKEEDEALGKDDRYDMPVSRLPQEMRREIWWA